MLSSVAGVRVRRANYVYGASKAGLDAFAQGMAEALRGSGASLMIVRPGWVATRMTDGRDPRPVRHHRPTPWPPTSWRGLERGGVGGVVAAPCCGVVFARDAPAAGGAVAPPPGLSPAP